MTEITLRERPTTIATARRVDRTAARSELIGRSPAMAQLRDIVTRVAPSQAPVIVTGPSGSGKEAVARAIHAGSNRATKPFVAINCGALSPELIESELFGHEKGAFTGAAARRTGRFEEASGGTLFLDEIGEMRPDMQVKLLRVLEDGVVHRVGGGPAVHVDVRIVSATHRDVLAEVEAGRFREDLYFRLGVLLVQTPSLADRPADICDLVAHFQAGLGSTDHVRFDASALERLERYDWPGNVRELRNVIERARVLFPASILTAVGVDQVLGNRPISNIRHLALPLAAPRPSAGIGQARVNLKHLVDGLERQHIGAALDAADGVFAEAARMLTLKRTTLIEKMRKLDVGGTPANDAIPHTPGRRKPAPGRLSRIIQGHNGDRQLIERKKTTFNSYVTCDGPPLRPTFLHNGYSVRAIASEGGI